jgi:hypothetical protein
VDWCWNGCSVMDKSMDEQTDIRNRYVISDGACYFSHAHSAIACSMTVIVIFVV